MKNPCIMNKVDLAREERVLKYDKLMDLFRDIYQMNRIQKIMKENKSTVLIKILIILLLF